MYNCIKIKTKRNETNWIESKQNRCWMILFFRDSNVIFWRIDTFQLKFEQIFVVAQNLLIISFHSLSAEEMFVQSITPSNFKSEEIHQLSETEYNQSKSNQSESNQMDFNRIESNRIEEWNEPDSKR
jgi:hypothetical protein